DRDHPGPRSINGSAFGGTGGGGGCGGYTGWAGDVSTPPGRAHGDCCSDIPRQCPPPHRRPATPPGVTSLTAGVPGAGRPGYQGPNATVAASTTPATASAITTNTSRTPGPMTAASPGGDRDGVARLIQSDVRSGIRRIRSLSSSAPSRSAGRTVTPSAT